MSRTADTGYGLPHRPKTASEIRLHVSGLSSPWSWMTSRSTVLVISMTSSRSGSTNTPTTFGVPAPRAAAASSGPRSGLT